MMKFTWTCQCYRCGASETELVEDAAAAEHAVDRFKLAHRGSCGQSAAFSSHVGHAPLTGDGANR